MKAVLRSTLSKYRQNGYFFLVAAGSITAVCILIIYSGLSGLYFVAGKLLLYFTLLLQMTGTFAAVYAVFLLLRRKTYWSLPVIVFVCVPLLVVQFLLIINLWLLI